MKNLTVVFLMLFTFVSYGAEPVDAKEGQPLPDQWLKERYLERHQHISAIVAVADMFFACNNERKIDPSLPDVPTLVLKTDKNQLAGQLRMCLRGEPLNSDAAINYGLVGCFYEQIKHLPEDEKKVKQKLVTGAIKRLSKAERQKSFTQCVADQAMVYLN